jgi:tRNA(fMet)-specific endonuclease VapC
VNYFLDTSTVVAILRNRPPQVRERLRGVIARKSKISVSSIVLFELQYGVERSSRHRENAEQLQAFLSGDIDVVPFDDEDARTAGTLRATLADAGNPIGPYDLLIAAQALRRDAVLVTSNGAEFARVRELTWQDWSLGRGTQS